MKMIIFVVLFVLAFLGTSSAQTGYELPAPGYGYNAPEVRGAASFLNEQSEDPLSVLARNIPGGGVPGSDYPILSSVPDTGFICEDQEFPGYFADTADEAGCQVFHICQFDGRLDSFLCPNGTIFNQQYFVCDWWNNVDCSMSEQFRSLNAEIGKIMEDTAASFRSDVVDPSQLYGVPQHRQQTPSQTYSIPQQRQQTPTQSYSASQQRQQTPVQTYSALQQRQQTPTQTYSAQQQRQQTPAQTYSAPEERQSVPAPSQVPVPAPVQLYNAPQERESVPTPSQSYGTPQDRQATVPPPSQIYNSPSRF